MARSAHTNHGFCESISCDCTGSGKRSPDRCSSRHQQRPAALLARGRPGSPPGPHCCLHWRDSGLHRPQADPQVERTLPALCSCCPLFRRVERLHHLARFLTPMLRIRHTPPLLFPKRDSQEVPAAPGSSPPSYPRGWYPAPWSQSTQQWGQTALVAPIFTLGMVLLGWGDSPRSPPQPSSGRCSDNALDGASVSPTPTVPTDPENHPSSSPGAAPLQSPAPHRRTIASAKNCCGECAQEHAGTECVCVCAPWVRVHVSVCVCALACDTRASL